MKIISRISDRNDQLRHHSSQKPYRSERSGAFDKHRTKPVRLFEWESRADYQPGTRSRTIVFRAH